MYFDSCKTLDELKSAYKTMALKNHPDMGGDLRTMQAINAEYDKVFERLKYRQNTAAQEPNSEARTTTESPEEFRAIVDVLLNMEGLEVELCGSWLWIGGNTYQYKDELKKAGCLYSRNKKRWYWRHEEEGKRWRKGSKSMKDIRDTYGSEWLGKAPSRKKITA